MEDHKKSFLINVDIYVKVKLLSNEDAGNLIKCVFHYVNNLPYQLNNNSFLREIFFEMVNTIEEGWSRFNPRTKKFNSNYKGGIAPENKLIRSSEENRIWRLRVFERDNYTCRGCRQHGGELNSHHIKEFAKYPALRFEVNNGLTLCKSCHIKTHSKIKLPATLK